MTQADLAKLAQNYMPGENADAGFDRVVGVALPNLGRLVTAIDADLDEHVYGIGWWKGHPIGDKRRILASDHMLQCLRSVEVNLREARLHQMSWVHCTAVDDASMLNAVSYQPQPNGTFAPMPKHPRRVKGTDDLARHLAEMHSAGFFRAIGSALDCLAGGIIGVTAVPKDLLKADFENLRSWFRTGNPRASSYVASYHRNLGAVLEGVVTAAGPADWTLWASQVRNMLVHRGRRWQISMLNPRKTGLLDGRGLPQLLTSVEHHLPTAPSHSDIEAMVAFGNNAPQLTEDAHVTLDGLHRSSTQLVEDVSAILLRAWLLRRAQPSTVPQPIEQWKNTPGAPVPTFPGYAPGAPLAMDTMMTSPEAVRRFRVAALQTADKPKWTTFT